MLNEELVILNKIQKYLKESYQNIGDAMISGGIDNMEKYKYMMGQAHAYLKILLVYLLLSLIALISATFPLFSPFLIMYF